MDFHKNLVESYKKTNGYNQLVYSLKEEVKKLKFFILIIINILPFFKRSCTLLGLKKMLKIVQ